MWIGFFLAIVVCCLVLYVPGFFIVRSFNIARAYSFVIAPVFSVFLLAALGVVFREAGIACSAIALISMATAIGILALIVSMLTRRNTTKNSKGLKGIRGGFLFSSRPVESIAGILALYIVIAAITSVFVYVFSIGDPLSFARNDDNTVHYSIVRCFLETGMFSTLHAGQFLDQGSAGGFYPSGWHVVTAIVASVFDSNVALASNASLFTIVVAVFPSSICLLLIRLFGKQRAFVLGGALIATAFCGFPWGFLVFGQLVSNLLSFALIPVVLVIAMEITDAKTINQKVAAGIMVLIGLASIAICQPNGVFTLGIWAVAYAVSRALYVNNGIKAAVNARQVVIAVVVVALSCVIWGALFYAPFMQRVVQNTWSALLSVPEALVSGLLFMFTSRESAQPLLSIFVLVGFLYTCKHRNYLWISVAFAFAMICYVLDISTEGYLKHLLTGFWYTDYYRTGAMTALFAIPLAALGVGVIARWLKTGIGRMYKKDKKNHLSEYSTALVVAAALIACQLFPLQFSVSEKKTISFGVTNIRHQLQSFYSWNKGLTSEEDTFIKRVMESIPQGSLVINVPRDGSCWSYGIEGLNTFYRRSSDTGENEDAQAAELFRTRLCDVSKDEQVQKKLEQLDARYVLFLDDLSSDDPTTIGLRYKAENWTGIESITPQTSGFTLIMQEGDMRLYQITA